MPAPGSTVGEVGVVEHDVRRLAAELEEHALQRARRRCAAMCLPTAVEPVNEIMSTRGSTGEHVADRRRIARR